MDEYTKKTKIWLEERFKRCDKDGIYYAHQPIYGMRKGYSESGLINRYIITCQIMKALSHLNFDSLIDIGGAEGYKAWIAKQLFGVNVKNSDLSEEACKRAEEIFHIESIPADIHELPFKDNEFDVVLCSETLEHTLDLHKAVRELLRIAGKAIVITVPHEPGEVVDQVKKEGIPHGHIHYFDLESFDFLKSDGCRILSRKMVSPILKKLSLYHLGKRAASLQIKMHEFICKVTPSYNTILFVILKDDIYWRKKASRDISAHRIINFAVPVKKIYKSFLIINTFGIGDVLFSTPLIRNLHEAFPAAKIYYLCNRRAAPILKTHPLIEKVFVYERDEFAAELKKSFFAGVLKYLRFISGIRKEKIDCAIDLSLSAPFGFFAFLAGIRKRYGLDYKNRSRFLNRTVKIDGFIDKHVADYYLDTLKLLDIPVKKCNLEVYSDSASKKWAEEFLEKNGISKEQIVIGIAPCGGDAFGKDNHLKRWPAEQFSLLIDRLIEEFKARIFIFAGPKEKDDVIGIINPLRNKKDVFEFSGSSLEITAALVERCQLFISNDTGILRFADALNKKIVAFYGPIDEKVYGPYPFQDGRTVILKKDLPCRPCYNKFRLKPCVNEKKCLSDIKTEEVLAAVKKLIT